MLFIVFVYTSCKCNLYILYNTSYRKLKIFKTSVFFKITYFYSVYLSLKNRVGESYVLFHPFFVIYYNTKNINIFWIIHFLNKVRFEFDREMNWLTLQVLLALKLLRCCVSHLKQDCIEAKFTLNLENSRTTCNICIIQTLQVVQDKDKAIWLVANFKNF